MIDTLSSRVSVQRELKVFRRPLSATILDDGSLLAVLSSDHRVNLYNLANRQLKHCRTLSLDNPPNTIALSPKGEVLAAAYTGGIEVHSLAGSASSTQRRAVKCDSVDSLRFSRDGTVLFGTTQNSKNPNTVVLSAPYYSETNEELPSTDILSHMWTSQILFPNNTRDCSHAALLPHHSEGDSCWAFTYDRVFESFRAVRTDDLRNGTTYFTGPKTCGRLRPRAARKKLVPCTLPATSDRGELVATGFFGKELWLYGVPESLDSTGPSQLDESSSRNDPVRRSSTSSSNGRSPGSPASALTSGEATELKRLPRWQVLVDRSRNVFAKGRRVMEIPGIAGVHWVSRKNHSPASYSVGERLIVVAPGGVSNPSADVDEFAIVDGGRLVILDFNRTKEDGKDCEFTVEVGNVSPEILEEEDIDMDTEIALVRQRTVRQRRDAEVVTSVAEILASPLVPPLPDATSSTNDEASPTLGNGSFISPRAQANQVVEGLSLEEASAVFDGPYSHTHPRSRSSLYRSATAVAANRQRNPRRILPEGPGELRRADGRGELPHESDADNWVPPPPPYTPDADRPLPEYFRMALMPSHTERMHRFVGEVESLRRTNTASAAHNFSSQRMAPLPEISMTSSPTLASDSQHRQLQQTLSDAQSPTASSRHLSFTGPSESAAANEMFNSNPHHAPETPSRRPLSAYVDRHLGSSPDLIQGRPTTVSPPVPGPLTTGSLPPAKSSSLPSSPITTWLRPRSLTLSGANLQRRLEYPLPLAPSPSNDGISPPVQPIDQRHRSATASPLAQDVEPISAYMPSPQQLANLHNRYRPSPPGESNRKRTRHPSDTIAPPRAALGAAASPSSPVAERRRAALAQRNSVAASSPSLLRPSARRLETIESIGSSVSGTRSRSGDIEVGRNLRRGRSRSLGPTPVARGEDKKGWFRRRGMKTARLRTLNVEHSGDVTDDIWVRSADEGDVKASKCHVM